MSVVLIRPVCPEGKLPSTDWDYPAYSDYASWDDWATSDIVDAVEIIRNWLVILNHVNGNLNGSDLAEGVAALSETTFVLDEEVSGDVWPTAYQRHSHDNYDSAPLGAATITAALMGAVGYGALRHPANTDMALAMHGSFVVDPLASSLYNQSIAILYDWYFWDPTGNGYLFSATDGTTRVIGTPVIADFLDWTADQQKNLFALSSIKTVSTDDITDVAMRIQSMDSLIALPVGWQFDWVILALV